MTFLIAGDSFAQVGTEFYSLQQPDDYNKPDPDFVHWSRLIADKHNANSYCIGMPGYDLKTTVFAALAKLQQHKDITHCMFHVTEWSRSLMWGVDKTKEDVATLYNRLNSHAYSTEGPKVPTNYLEHYHKELDILVDVVSETENQDMDNRHLVHIGSDWISHIFKEPHTYGLSNDKYKRLKHVMHSSMDHNFFSDRVNYLISLIAYCNTNNIKLCLVNNFSSDYVQSLSQFGIFDHFDTLQCLSDNNMKINDWDEARGKQYSHLYENEHRALALYFLKLFPHWQK
jgi:hypothetical protein